MAQETNVSIEYDVDSIPVPAFTFCPMRLAAKYSNISHLLDKYKTLEAYFNLDEEHDFVQAEYLRMADLRNEANYVDKTVSVEPSKSFVTIADFKVAKCTTFNPPVKELDSAMAGVSISYANFWGFRFF